MPSNRKPSHLYDNTEFSFTNVRGPLKMLLDGVKQRIPKGLDDCVIKA